MSSLPPGLIDRIAALLSLDEIDGPDAPGGDLFTAAAAPELVVRPANASAVPPLLAALAEACTAFAAWGGRTSYSSATFVPDRPWIAIDTSALDTVLHVEPDDLLVTVEAGCSWAKLNDRLRDHGLRTGFWGPASGRHATIGGTLSQHGVFFGSARYGTSADGVLGMKVALPDGRCITTGSAGLEPATPFFRHVGPDLTGLFLGDCGSLGIKLETTLRCIPLPRARRYGAWSFARAEQCASALNSLAARNLVSDAIALHGERFDLHAACEEVDEALVDLKLNLTSHICRSSAGVPIEPAALGAMHADPFPPLAMLGSDHDRWVPVHTIVPHSRHVAAIETARATLAQERPVCDDHGIGAASVSLAVGAGAVLVEVNLTWPGIPNRLTDDFLSEAGCVVPMAGTEAQWRAVRGVRERIARAWQQIGGVQFQIGRLFPHRSRQDAVATAIYDALKQKVDPHGIANPGVLDL